MKITLDKTRNSATQRQFMELRAGKILCLLLASLALTVLFNSCEDSFPLAISYKIQYNANANDAINVPENTEVLVGENLTEPSAPSRKGFTFEGWFTDSMLTNKFDFENTKITDNTILYAKWTQSKLFHIVTVYPNYPEGSNGSGTEFSRKIATGGLFTALDSLQFTPPTPDKSFAGWYTNAVQELGEQFHPAQTPVTSDLKLYAAWTDKPVYTVKFDKRLPDSDQADYYHETQIISGNSVSPPIQDPFDEVYNFQGWIDSNGNIFNFEHTNIFEDTTIRAKWDLPAYTVTFDVLSTGGEPASAPAKVVVLHNKLIDEPETKPTRRGYTFSGWYKVPNSINMIDRFDFQHDTITGDTTLYAGWSIESYEVSFDVGGGSNTIPAKQIVQFGNKATEPSELNSASVHKDGAKKFAGWCRDLGNIQVFNFDSVITENITLYAIWLDEVTHTVVYMSKGKAVDRIQVEDGAKISAPTLSAAASIPGSSVEGWYRDASFGTKFDFDSEPIKGPLTLYAKWEKNIYTIRIYSDTSGITIPTITKFYGETLNENDIKSDTPDDYAFLGWYTDSSYNTPYTFGNTVNGDVEIYSKWHIKDMKYIALHTKEVPAEDDLANYDALCREVFSFYKPGASVKTLYVKPDSSGEGTSWTDAGSLYEILPEFDRPLSSINADVAKATADDIRLVLVHAGKYNIGEGTNPGSISMYNNVAIVGGWDDWDRNGKSTLEQFQLFSVIHNGQNVAGALDRTALLYGFTAISTKKGQAFVHNSYDSPVFIDITFTGGYNTNFPNAVGMNNYDSNPLLKRVVFTNQSSVQGAGVAIVNVDSSPIIIGAVFSENVNVDSEISAEDYFEYIFDPINGPDNIFASDVKYKLNHYGTAIKNEGNSHTILINATVRDNYSFSYTISNDENSTMDIVNTIVWGNKTAEDKYVSNNVSIYNSIIEGGNDPNPKLGTENRMINDYFGSFLTNELQSGSPAIDEGLWIRANKQYTDFYYSDNNSTWYSDPGLKTPAILPNDGTIDITALDARGYARTDRPDIGAWEYGL